MTPNNETPILLRLDQVLALFPVSKSTWYEGMKIGLYPKPVKISARSVAWHLKDIKELISTSNRQQN